MARFNPQCTATCSIHCADPSLASALAERDELRAKVEKLEASHNEMWIAKQEAISIAKVEQARADAAEAKLAIAVEGIEAMTKWDHDKPCRASMWGDNNPSCLVCAAEALLAKIKDTK